MHTAWLRSELDSGTVVAIGDEISCFRIAAVSMRLANDPTIVVKSNNDPSPSTNPTTDPDPSLKWVLPAFDFEQPERWPILRSQGLWDAVESLAGVTDEQLRTRGVPKPEVLLTKTVLTAAVMRALGMQEVVYVPSTGSCLGILTTAEMWKSTSK